MSVVDDTFSLFSNYNCFLKHPPVVSISNNRIFVINEIYNAIESWSENDLDMIQYSYTHLRYEKDKVKKTHWLKACMAEEFVHRLALFEPKDVNNQHELYQSYYKYSTDYLKQIKEKKIVNNTTGVISSTCFTQSFLDMNTALIKLINDTPDDISSKIHLELHYTKMSIYLEIIWHKSKDKRSCIKTVGQSDILNLLETKFSSYNYGYTTIHNGDTLTSPYECMLCTDSCTNYADCMYSNCRHMCICYSCSSKLPDIDRSRCIICRQHNDCLIQVFKP